MTKWTANRDSQSMCANCPAPCCSLRVHPNTYDILRIASNKAMPLNEFLVLEEVQPGDNNAVRVFGKILRLVLRFDENGSCVFRDKTMPLGCKIEEYKPGICLTYPMRLGQCGPEVRKEIVCHADRISKVDLAKMSKRELDDAQWEDERYQQILEDWNRTAKDNATLVDFFAFAFKEMEMESGIAGAVRRRLRRVLTGILYR